jgi:hypothetical protein
MSEHAELTRPPTGERLQIVNPATGEPPQLRRAHNRGCEDGCGGSAQSVPTGEPPRRMSVGGDP